MASLLRCSRRDQRLIVIGFTVADGKITRDAHDVTSIVSNKVIPVTRATSRICLTIAVEGE